MNSTRRSHLLLLCAVWTLLLLLSPRGLLVDAGADAPLSSPATPRHAPLTATTSLSVTTFLPLVSGNPPFGGVLIDGPWSGLPSGAGLGVTWDSQRSALTLSSDPTRLLFVARPDASTTGYANSIWDLGTYDGRLYLGYGDPWNNHGPVDIVSYDPATGALTAEMPDVPEEQLGGWFQGVDGRFYVSGSDSQEDWTFGSVYVNDGVAWSKLRTIPRGVHIYRVVQFPGRLFADYASDAPSPVPYISALVSTDLGATWSYERVDDNPGPRPMVIDDLELVFHRSGPKLYAIFAMDLGSPDEVRRLYRYDGHIWERVVITDPRGEFLPYRMIAFGSQILAAGFIRNSQTGYRSSAVYVLDGQTQREVSFLLGKYLPRESCTVHDAWLYCLLQQPSSGDPVAAYALYRTTDLSTWETVAAPVTLVPGVFPRSLAFAAERLYVGAIHNGWQETSPGIIELTPALVYTIENATLEWDADVPEGTQITFRLRSSVNNYVALMSKPFVGPDGSPGTAFETSGEALNAMHNGDVLLQLTLTKATTVPGVWPTVRSVTLRGSRGAVTFAVDEGTGLYAAANLRDTALYTSIVYRLQEPIASGTLSFVATTPPSTTVRFQVRSAARESQLTSLPFVGPDGTPASYYESTGQALWAGHDGGLMIQYRAELASTNRAVAPFLRQVVLVTRADRLHHLSISLDSSGLWLAGEPRPVTVTAHLENGSLSPVSGQVLLSAKGDDQPDPLVIRPSQVTLVRGTGTTSILFQSVRRSVLCASLGPFSTCSEPLQVGPGLTPVSLRLTTDLGSPAPNWSPWTHAGQPFGLTVTVQDRYRNQVSGYQGSVRCDLWDRTARNEVVAPYAYQPSDRGVHRFDVTVLQVGEWNLVCRDVSNPRVAGSLTIAIRAVSP